MEIKSGREIQWELYLSVALHCRHKTVPTATEQSLVKLCVPFFIDLWCKNFFSKKISSKLVLFELWYALNQKKNIQVLWKP